MPTEIERKYLVRNDRWRELSESAIRYRQGYLSIDPARSVRVRIAGDSAALTIKGLSKGASRDEFEYSIPTDDAEHMLAELCLKPAIEKTRHTIAFAGQKWEVDEFRADNQGLIVAEVELDEETQDLALPDWLGAEITSDPRYANLNLVTHPYSRWQD
jgi:CYTH domain-containing protein